MSTVLLNSVLKSDKAVGHTQENHCYYFKTMHTLVGIPNNIFLHLLTWGNLRAFHDHSLTAHKDTSQTTSRILGRKMEAVKANRGMKELKLRWRYRLAGVMLLASLRKMWNMCWGSKMFETWKSITSFTSWDGPSLELNTSNDLLKYAASGS